MENKFFIKKNFFFYIYLIINNNYKLMSKREPGYDWLVKLLIIGDSGVGKTNILVRFCESNFIASHLTTIGKSIIFTH